MKLERIRDGTELVIRPLGPEDEPLLEEAFARMSEETRYRRFLAATPEVRPTMLRYLCAVDHHDHEALIAIDPRTGEIVGEVRYVRCDDRPHVAEMAVTVVDAWQGRGVGSRLLERLADRARHELIERFDVYMLAGNTEMMELLRHLSEVRVLGHESGSLHCEAEIPALPRPLRRRPAHGARPGRSARASRGRPRAPRRPGTRHSRARAV